MMTRTLQADMRLTSSNLNAESMKRLFLFFAAALLLLSLSCKKKSGGGDGTVIETVELSSTPNSNSFGRDYTFKVRFTQLGDVVEFGVVYKSWVSDETDKTPQLDDADSKKIPFGASATESGKIYGFDKTLSYSEFNDASYRAYAVLGNGHIVYGEVLYISFA